ncbi:MAG: chromosomal replication initiator protein DnaA [Chloroflexota bacterium]|nr:MAG: chromosomal replication initiator protein DnaA [Chloroflexota bacterium]
MEAKQAWQATLGQLQLEMPKAAFDTWVKDTEFISFDDNIFRVRVQNAYARDWLDNRLKSSITRLLTGSMGKKSGIQFVVGQNDYSKKEVSKEDASHVSEEAQKQTNGGYSLNGRYSFENFIVGTGNRLAHAASMAVAEKPAQTYNPLFLYGGVGLGKTHLLHAIGNMCVKNGLKVLYVSSEEFTNDLIGAIRSHTTQAFREKYRLIDVLLVDDIQFIAGKESTQEEFFHTFNTLHGQNKQIIMTSDRPPKAMVTLEERLRSRFEWGLAADIQPPDYETRVAILRSKAEQGGYNVPSEILEGIAHRFQANIRELEGALTRVMAYADLRGMALDRDLLDAALADLIPQAKDVAPEQILDTIAGEFAVSTKELISQSRTRRIAFPRQVAMYVLREEAEISLPQIGQLLGGRDHTTVMYGHDKIADLLETDDGLRRKIIKVRESLYGPAAIPV